MRTLIIFFASLLIISFANGMTEEAEKDVCLEGCPLDATVDVEEGDIEDLQKIINEGELVESKWQEGLGEDDEK